MDFGFGESKMITGVHLFIIMKIFKVVLIAIAVFIGTSASAQNSPITFGVKAGLNLSNYYGDDTSSLDPKVGFNVGVTMDYAFSPALYLMTGLDLTTKGAKQSVGSGTITYNPMYLQVPVHIGYKLDVAPGTKIVFHAGPYVAYGVGGKVSVKGSGVTASWNIFEKIEIDELSFSGFDRFDFGAGFGVGAEFGRIGVGIGYDLGFANVFRDKNDSKSHNMNAALTVGYRF
jgi:hypothetical protein